MSLPPDDDEQDRELLPFRVSRALSRDELEALAMLVDAADEYDVDLVRIVVGVIEGQRYARECGDRPPDFGVLSVRVVEALERFVRCRKDVS